MPQSIRKEDFGKKRYIFFLYIINGAEFPHGTILDGWRDWTELRVLDFFVSRRLNMLLEECIDVVGHVIVQRLLYLRAE